MSTDKIGNEGMFGPGIFGTGIDLSALDEQTAWSLGVFFGEQLSAAEARGRAGAIADLRARYEESDGLLLGYASAAAYLEAKGHQP